jgi:hypothetical protein
LSQVVDERLWGADGGVAKFARTGSTLYLAGGFSLIGPNSGGGVPLDARTGSPLRPYAKVAGVVHICISDGEGGWFIGGEFSAVGGQLRGNVAHVLRDGRVARWRADTDGRVNALALSRQTLYIGGEFYHVSGQVRHYLAAVDVAWGSALKWDPDPSGVGSSYTGVNAILVSGGMVYVGGDFAAIGGASRRNLAALDVGTGRADGFSPDPDGRVRALAMRDGTLYVGGEFRTIVGQSRRCLAAISLPTGDVRAWDARVGSADYDYDVLPFVHSLAVTERQLFVAGHFTRAGGQIRGGVASLDLATGDATGWNPHPVDEQALTSAPYIFAVAVRSDVAYIGGQFVTLGTKPRLNAGAVSLTTGLATDFDPRLSSEVYSLAASGDAVYVGGGFATLWDWQLRKGLAAIDLDSGELLPWNPDPGGGYVMALAAGQDAVYVGGRFSLINGEPRSGLAALDPVTGAVKPWNPGCNGSVNALAASDGRVLVGGYFTSVGGLPRQYVAALDSATGAPTPWDPGADFIVRTIVPAGPTIYIGGFFDFAGGQPRRGLAELDAVSGLATSWNPGTDGIVLSLAVTGDVVYAGGYFSQIGGASRTALAALDRTTGAATDWNPEPGDSPYAGEPHIESLLASDGVIYAAGDFRRIGGAERTSVAALDAASGEATSWNPSAFGGIVAGLLEHEHKIYMGGTMTRLGPFPVGYFGACSAAPARRPARQPLALGRCLPNPARTGATIPFELPVAANATLAVYDVQGRRIATVLGDAQRPAGPQAVGVDVSGWPVGCYLYRLEAAGMTATRKMIVVR